MTNAWKFIEVEGEKSRKANQRQKRTIMTEPLGEIEALVSELNRQFDDQTGNKGNSYRPFEFRSNGDDQIIQMFRETIWTSFEDQREEREGTKSGLEPLANYVLREANKMLVEIQNVELH